MKAYKRYSKVGQSCIGQEYIAEVMHSGLVGQSFH